MNETRTVLTTCVSTWLLTTSLALPALATEGTEPTAVNGTAAITPTVAIADDGAAPTARAARSPKSVPWLSIDVPMGIGRLEEPDHTSFFGTLALQVLHRPSWLTVGGSAEVAQEPSIWGEDGQTQYYVAAIGGVTVPLADWLAIEALAEAGAHARTSGDAVHIAETNEVASETSSVLLPFVGIKIAPTTTLGTFRVGPWLQGRTDIGRPEIDTDASDGAKTTGGGTFVAGGLTVGAALDG